MAKSLVVAPFIPVAAFMASHRAAQGVIYADMIKQATGDEVVVNFGGKVLRTLMTSITCMSTTEMTGLVDLISMVEQKGFPYAWNFRNLTLFKGPVISLAHPIPRLSSTATRETGTR
jgi:hypothetical protein